MTLHEQLLKVKEWLNEGHHYHLAHGICRALWDAGGREQYQTQEQQAEKDYQLYKLFSGWPKFSGSTQYPVPHPEYSPLVAYNHGDGFTYYWTGEYGQNRRELLDFMIEETEPGGEYVALQS